MSNLHKALGASLRTARKAAGMTIYDAGGKAGLYASHVSMMERGVTGASLESLIALGRVVGVPAWQLLRQAQETPGVAA